MSHTTEKLAVIIPTLNEAGNMSVLLNRLRNALDPTEINYELIVVDDDSQDGTADVVRDLAKPGSRIRASFP